MYSYRCKNIIMGWMYFQLALRCRELMTASLRVCRLCARYEWPAGSNPGGYGEWSRRFLVFCWIYSDDGAFSFYLRKLAMQQLSVKSVSRWIPGSACNSVHFRQFQTYFRFKNWTTCEINHTLLETDPSSIADLHKAYSNFCWLVHCITWTVF